MARLRYRPTPADFVIGLGAQTELLDADELPLDPQRFGRTAAVPLTSDAFDVYLDADLTTVTTDLLDEGGSPLTQWVSSDQFATLGRGPAIQGPDGHEGPVYISADGVVGYRIEPDSDVLYGRVTALEAPKSITTLSDVSETAPTDGQVLVFDNGTGQYAPSAAAGTGTVTSVNDVEPDTEGNVDLSAADVDAATAADMADVKQNVARVLIDSGSGYPSKNGYRYGEFQGTTQPSTGVVDGDKWLKPKVTEST